MWLGTAHQHMHACPIFQGFIQLNPQVFSSAALLPHIPPSAYFSSYNIDWTSSCLPGALRLL